VDRRSRARFGTGSTALAALRRRPSGPLLAALGLLTLLSLAILVVPALQFAVLAPGLDLVVNTTVALAAAAAGGLTWARWREFGQRRDLLEAAGFSVLAVSGAAVVAVAVSGAGDALGFSLRRPEQGPVYLWTVGRLLAACLFVAATAAPVGRGGADGTGTDVPNDPEPGFRAGGARLWLVGPSLLFLAAAPVVLTLSSSLPPLIGPEGIAHLRSDPGTPAGLPGVTAAGLGIQLAVAVLFLAAALRVDAGGPDEGLGRSIESRYLALGYVLAAFSQLHMAFYPGVYIGLVTTADALRVAFSIVVLLGIQEQSRHDLRDLRLAAARAARLRAIELERVAREERAWLARELHDGLAQDLWLAKLRLGRLRELLGAGSQPSGADLRALADGASQGLDRALDAARSAVQALRAESSTPPPLDELLARSAEALHERAAIATELRLASPRALLPAHVTVELWRIAQEALTNVAKHAEATVVCITTRVVETPVPTLELEVTDNGRGFRRSAPHRGLGLKIMAERARAIGATLSIESQPRDGTRVLVRLPLHGSPAGPAEGERA
jgi:signal transduction histidine kinase